MANNMRLSLILSAKDRLSSVVRTSVLKSEKAFDRFERRIDNISRGFNDVGKKAAVMGTAALAASGLMLKSASDFETGMTNVSTLIDTNTESLSLMNKQVLAIAKKTPVALDQLTSALYDIRSAGISAEDQFRVLEKSAQLGIAGLGTTKEAVDLVTSSINAFKLRGKEQDKLYDNIFKTVKTGKTTISQLAQGFGAVAGTVAAANIKIDDYLASVAALTTTGQPAAQAHTQMKAAIAGLTRGTKEQQAIFRSLYARDFNDLIKKSGSVVNAFSGIYRAVGGNKSKLIELLGSIEAYNAVLSLTGNQNKAYVDTIQAMRYGADMFSEAYQKQLLTINSQLQRGRNLLQKIGIDFGTYLMPSFTRFLNLAEGIMNRIDALPDGMKEFIAITTVGAGAGLLAFGTLSMGIGVTINWFNKFLKSYRTVALFMKKHRFTAEIKAIRTISSAVRGLGLALAGTPVGWIVAGITAIAVAGLLIYKYWKPITAFFKGVGEGIHEALAPTLQEVQGYLRPLQPIFTAVCNAGRAFMGWIVSLITPVNTAGEKSHTLGVSVGKFIGAFINGAFAVGKFLLKTNPLIAATIAIYKNFDRICNVVARAKSGLLSFFNGIGKGRQIEIAAKTKGAKVDGSHANGLAYVPRDGYIAELHRGERVLTADENMQLKYTPSSPSSPVHYVFAPVIHAQNSDIKEIEAMIERKQREFFNKIETERRRKEVRRYA